MRLVLSLIMCSLLSFSCLAAPKVSIDNVKVVITEKGKEPVKVTMPYWVAKNSAEVTDKLKVGTEEIPMKQIIQVIDKAPKLGTVMTIEEGGRKIVISIH